MYCACSRGLPGRSPLHVPCCRTAMPACWGLYLKVFAPLSLLSLSKRFLGPRWDELA